jgi:hypothetical protein
MAVVSKLRNPDKQSNMSVSDFLSIVLVSGSGQFSIVGKELRAPVRSNCGLSVHSSPNIPQLACAGRVSIFDFIGGQGGN